MISMLRKQKPHWLTEVLETISIKPTKTDILVQLGSLAWAPYWKDETGNLTPAW